MADARTRCGRQAGRAGRNAVNMTPVDRDSCAQTPRSGRFPAPPRTHAPLRPSSRRRRAAYRGCYERRPSVARSRPRATVGKTSAGRPSRARSGRGRRGGRIARIEPRGRTQVIECGVENLEAAILVGHRSVMFGRRHAQPAAAVRPRARSMRFNRGAERLDRSPAAATAAAHARSTPTRTSSQGDDDSCPDRTRHP